MYSYEDRVRAVQLYIKYDRSIADTIEEKKAVVDYYLEHGRSLRRQWDFV